MLVEAADASGQLIHLFQHLLHNPYQRRQGFFRDGVVRFRCGCGRLRLRFNRFFRQLLPRREIQLLCEPFVVVLDFKCGARIIEVCTFVMEQFCYDGQGRLVQYRR